MAATARTDIYRPSAPDFDPEEFDLLGVFDLHPEDGTPPGVRAAIIGDAVDRGYRFAGVHPTGQCDHCGARIRYEAILRHLPTRRLITVGETCLDNRFAYGTKEDFALLRREAARKAEITRERNRLHETAVEAVAWLDGADETLAELTYVGNGGAVDCSGFLSDIARSLFRYGSLTARQEEVAAAAVRRDAARRQREAEREAEQARRRQTANPAPTGRVTVEGTVGPTWTQTSDYSFSGYVEKFRVHADGGYDVVATIPAALLRLDEVESHESLRNRRVRFTATLKPMDDDPTAAWASRPSKAEIV